MGQVLGKLLSQQKKHQKDELLEDPAAGPTILGRSHSGLLFTAPRYCLRGRSARDSEESWRIIKLVAYLSTDFVGIAKWG